LTPLKMLPRAIGMRDRAAALDRRPIGKEQKTIGPWKRSTSKHFGNGAIAPVNRAPAPDRALDRALDLG
jgi:hypothetical protein